MVLIENNKIINKYNSHFNSNFRYFNQVTGPSILDDYKRKYPDLDIWSTEACTGSFANLKGQKNVELGNWGKLKTFK